MDDDGCNIDFNCTYSCWSCMITLNFNQYFSSYYKTRHTQLNAQKCAAFYTRMSLRKGDSGFLLGWKRRMCVISFPKNLWLRPWKTGQLNSDLANWNNKVLRWADKISAIGVEKFDLCFQPKEGWLRSWILSMFLDLFSPRYSHVILDYLGDFPTCHL